MRRAFVIIVASILAASAPSTAQSLRQFQVYASVLDVLGEPVLRLAPEDLRLMEDGTEVKVIGVEPVNRQVKLQVLPTTAWAWGRPISRCSRPASRACSRRSRRIST